MIEKIKRWLGRRPIDAPRDDFTHRFWGALCNPTFRCTVCDEEVESTVAELDEFMRLVEYRCPECHTEGCWITKFGNKDKTVIMNIYPNSWQGNPYDAPHGDQADDEGLI